MNNALLFAYSGSFSESDAVYVIVGLCVAAAVILAAQIFLATRRKHGVWLGLFLPFAALCVGLYAGRGLNIVPALALFVVYCVCQMNKNRGL